MTEPKPPPKPTIVEALAAVAEDVRSIRKDNRNDQQGFNFRGIDAVVNAVGPAFRTHGVVCVPLAQDVTYESYTTSRGTGMRNCVVTVQYRFYGPAGDSIDACVLGEASDAGDKATSKAFSVAYRTLLLQALTIPTDERDPDADSHERAELPSALMTVDQSNALDEWWNGASEVERDEFLDWHKKAKMPHRDKQTVDQAERSLEHMREITKRSQAAASVLPLEGENA